jgi:hypothetical protein
LAAPRHPAGEGPAAPRSIAAGSNIRGVVPAAFSQAATASVARPSLQAATTGLSVAPQVFAGREARFQPGIRGLTSHSSRRRSATRLNSGVRPSMNQSELVSKLINPLADLPPGISTRDVILAAITWPTEGWLPPALDWIDQGASIDREIVDALELVVATTTYTQRTRHRAFSIAKRWRRTQSGA